MSNSNQKLSTRKNTSQSKEMKIEKMSEVAPETKVDREIALMKTELNKKIQDNQAEMQKMIAEFEKRVGLLTVETKERAMTTTSGKQSTLSDRVKNMEKKFEESIAKVHKTIIDTLNPQMNCLTLVERYGHFQPAFVWTKGKVKEMVFYVLTEAKSEVFQWTAYPIKAQVVIKVKMQEVFLSLSLDEENQEKLRRLKVSPQIYYLLKDGSGNGEHRCRGVSQLFDKSTNFESHIHGRIYPVKIEERFIVDDCVMIEVYVEPISMAKQVHSYDGTLEWALSEYSKRLKLEKKNTVLCQDSPYFYTAPKGFRVKVEMWLRGKNSHNIKNCVALTTCVKITKGLFDEVDYDDEDYANRYVKKRFAHRITVTLVNQKEPQRSITKSVDGKFDKDQEFDIVMIESKEEEANLPIENDTLYYKVIVKAIE